MQQVLPLEMCLHQSFCTSQPRGLLASCWHILTLTHIDTVIETWVCAHIERSQQFGKTASISPPPLPPRELLVCKRSAGGGQKLQDQSVAATPEDPAFTIVLPLSWNICEFDQVSHLTIFERG